MAEPARQLDTIDVRPVFTAEDAAAMEARFAGVATQDLLAALLAGELKGRVAAVSSFGAESAVLLHMIAAVDRDVPVIFTNTQKMFGETLAYRDELAERLGFTDLRVLLAADAWARGGEKIQGVWVCAPTAAHAALIERAARAGAHVACEKPVGLSAAEIARAYDVCRDCDVGLHCLFQRRSDTSYKALLDRLPAEGAPRTIRCVFRDHPTPPRAFLESCGGDVYHDLATHDLDFALAALRKATGADGVRLAPDEVYAVGLDAAFAAVITVTWRALGVAGTFEVARASAYGYDQRCEVWTATGAALSVGNHVATSLEVGGAAGVVSSQLVESFPERFRAAFAEDVAHFARAFASGS